MLTPECISLLLTSHGVRAEFFENSNFNDEKRWKNIVNVRLNGSMFSTSEKNVEYSWEREVNCALGTSSIRAATLRWAPHIVAAHGRASTEEQDDEMPGRLRKDPAR